MQHLPVFLHGLQTTFKDIAGVLTVFRCISLFFRRLVSPLAKIHVSSQKRLSYTERDREYEITEKIRNLISGPITVWLTFCGFICVCIDALTLPCFASAY